MEISITELQKTIDALTVENEELKSWKQDWFLMISSEQTEIQYQPIMQIRISISKITEIPDTL